MFAIAGGILLAVFIFSISLLAVQFFVVLFGLDEQSREERRTLRDSRPRREAEQAAKRNALQAIMDAELARTYQPNANVHGIGQILGEWIRRRKQ